MASEPAQSDAFDRRGFWPAFALLAALTAALPLRYHYLPFLDWPQHCAMASIAGHFHNPKWGFDKYYVENPWFYPYHVLRWLQIGLGRVLGDSLGFRAALLVWLLGTPACAYALVRRFGRDRWLALGAFCVVVDSNLYWGFAPYVTGVALMLWANVVTVDVLQKGGAWRLVLLGFIGIAVFFTHPQSAAMCAASCGLLALAALIARRVWFADVAWVAVALLPSFGLLCLFLFSHGWVGGAKGSTGHGSVLNQSVSFDPPLLTLERLQWTTGLRLTGSAPYYSYLAALAASLAAGFAQWRLRRRAPVTPGEGTWAFEIPVLFGLWTLMVFCLPTWYRGEPLSVRIPTLLVLVAPWLAPVRPPREPRERRLLAPYRVVVVGAALLSLGWAHYRFAQYDRSMAPLDGVIDHLPRDSRVASMIYGVEPLGIIPMPTYVHIGGYLTVARGGMSSFSFTPYAADVGRYSLTVQVWAPSSGWQLPSVLADYYDYVFVRKGASYPGTPFAGTYSRARRIFAEGDFELWRTNRT